MGIIYLLLLFNISCNNIQEKQSEFKRLKDKAKEAKTYCKANKMDTSFCILIDMKRHSGKYRFFVWDFKTDTILERGLCSHGDCGGIDIPKGEKMPYFTNQPNSHCSSLGKYKIGTRGVSNFGIGINYKLHGLEPTNSNAFKRIIVLHSFDNLENEEIYPRECVESWGCPTISNQLLASIDNKLQKAKQPVLLWIFND